MKKNRSGKELLRIYSYGLFIMLLSVAITYQFIEPAPPSKLVIAAGSRGGAYLEFAKRYQKHLQKDGVSLKILKTAGSLENLKLLAEGKADIALMQSGIAQAQDYPQMLGIGSLYFEPLWVFVRPGATLTNLSQLYKSKVILGPEGSGTRKVVLQLLEDNDINTANLNELHLTGMVAAEALRQSKVDVLFLVAAPSSAMVKTLLFSKDVSLINITRADAYTRRHNFLSKVILPQGVISLAKNIPAHDVTLVAPAATLVTTEHLHPALAGLLTQVVADVHNKGSVLNGDRHKFPSAEYLDFPLSDDARRFYRRGVPLLQRYLPFWAAIQLDRLKLLLLPFLALLLPLAKILPLTYRWRMRSRIYRWYDTLQTLDYEIRQNLTNDAVTVFIKRLDSIEDDVRQINVPLAYAAELYSLRHHIDLLRRQISEMNLQKNRAVG